MQDAIAPSDSHQHRCHRMQWAATFAAWIVFAALAVRVTWPMPCAMNTDLPMGTETAVTVPLFNLWTVWWNADRAAAGLQNYWNAPIFYPTEGTFAFSEAQPTTIIAAPLVWLTGTPVAAYNVYLLATLWLNGVCAYRLLRERTFAWWPALCGGMLIETLPFVVWQLGVLQLTVLWASLWTISAVWRWRDDSKWTRAVEIGVGFGITYLTCNYYGFFLALLLMPVTVGLCRRQLLTRRTWGHALLAMLAAGCLAGPVIRVQQHYSQRHGWQRDINKVLELSAHVRDYTNTPWPQWFDRWELPEDQRQGWALGPAWLQWICAGIGIVCGLMQPRWRRWTWFALGIGGLALLFSLGPRLEPWGISPYRWLWVYLPGVKQIRSPFRFAVFVQMAVTWLAVITLQGLVPHVENWGRRSWRQSAVLVAAWLPVVFAGVALMLETRPINSTCLSWPGKPSPQWVEYLRVETPPDTVIVCLPFTVGIDVHDYEPATRSMMWGTQHRRRMINGYSGYFPEPYLKFTDELANFPATGAALLAESKIDLAVIDRRRISSERIRQTEPTSTWEWLFSDDVEEVDVYRIQPPPSPKTTRL